MGVGRVIGTTLGWADAELRRDPILAAHHRDDQRATIIRQTPIAAIVFLVPVVGFSLVESIIRPDHRLAIQVLAPFPFLVCIGALLAVRFVPQHALGIAVVAVNALIAIVMSYTAMIAGSAELAALAVTLILGGVVALLPLGPRHQLLASVTAVVGYPLILQVGAMSWTTPWYSGGGLMTAVVVMAIGAATIEGYRLRILRQALSEARLAQENERLMREARQANEIKTEFLATASHELRTPLGAIVGYTDLMLDGTIVDDEDRTDALGRMRRQALSMLDMLQNLLDAEKIQAGEARVDWEGLDLGELLGQLRAALPPTWEKPGVAIVWDLPQAPVQVRTDRNKLTTIIRNLVHNAIKHTAAGEVRVTLEAPRREGSAARIIVADTGEGIAPEDLPHIFERYRQGRSPARSGSLGLGLFIVRRFAAAIEVEVEVESERGRGTCFTVRLPLALDREASMQSPERT